MAYQVLGRFGRCLNLGWNAILPYVAVSLIDLHWACFRVNTCRTELLACTPVPGNKSHWLCTDLWYVLFRWLGKFFLFSNFRVICDFCFCLLQAIFCKCIQLWTLMWSDWVTLVKTTGKHFEACRAAIKGLHFFCDAANRVLFPLFFKWLCTCTWKISVCVRGEPRNSDFIGVPDSVPD